MLDYPCILGAILIGILAIVILYPGIRLFFYAVFRSFFQAKEVFEERKNKKLEGGKNE